MSGFQQNQRLVTLSTPLGRDALLMSGLEGTEEISALFKFKLALFADNRRQHEIVFEKLLGQEVTVRLRMPGVEPRYFSGLCHRFAQGYQDLRLTYYEAEIVPKFWLLTQRIRSRIFQRMSVPQILQKLLAGLEVSYQLVRPHEEREYCVQYRESDFDFSSRLMEEEGIYYFFEHHAKGHRLIISDTNVSHLPVAAPGTVRYNLEESTNLDPCVHHWLKRQELRTGKVTLWDSHFQLPGNNLKAERRPPVEVRVGTVEHKLQVGGNDSFEIYEHPGGFAKRFDGVATGGSEQTERLQKIFEENERTARLRMEAECAAAVVIEGASNCAHFTSGYKFTLDRHPHANGEYVFQSLQHTLKAGTAFHAEQNEPFTYENRFRCFPAQIEFRPARRTPKPIIAGVQTAFVVGPESEEIHVDPHARVKLHFQWDRESKQDENSSCWVRVAHSSAGLSFGGVSHPRIGQEVIVDFEEGDPDRPIVTGRVYNARTTPHHSNAGRDGKTDNIPPPAAPQAKMMTSFKSNSTPGGGGFNEITMNDTKGGEGLFLKAQKDEIHNVGNDREDAVGNNETRKVAVNRKREVGNNETVTVGTNQILSVGVNRAITVGVNETKTIHVCRFLNTMLANNDFTGVMRGIETGAVRFDFTGLAMADIVGLVRSTISGLIHYELTGLYRTERVGLGYTLKAGTSVITEAGEKAGLKAGTKIVIEAPDITLKGAGGHIRIDANGVTIKGTKVKVNSGGSPGSLSDDDAAAGAAGAAAGKGAAAAPGAASSGYQSALAKFLDKLGVPDKYLKVLDGLLNDPFNIPFEDLKAIAPTMGELLKHIPKEILPDKLRGPAENLLKLLASELAPDDSPERKKQNEADRKSALDGLTKAGKDAVEQYAKNRGLDLDKVTGGDGSSEKPGNNGGTSPSTKAKTGTQGGQSSVSNLTAPSTAPATTGPADDGPKGVSTDVSQTIANNAESVAADYRSRGVEYEMGGDAANDGSSSDCSHYVHDVINQSGVDVPYESTSTIGNSAAYQEVDPTEARAGDVVVQGGHMGIHSGSTDDKGRTNATQMGNHGAGPGKFGPDGYFNPDQPMKIYRPRTRNIS